MPILWPPRILVVLHVFDCRNPAWEHAMVGTPEQPGRIPTAIAAAMEFGVEKLLVFRDREAVHPDGRNEAEVIRDTLFDLIDCIAEFGECLPVLRDHTPAEIRAVMEAVFEISDVFITNTADEIREALPICKRLGADQVVFVSNVDHIPRIVQLVGEHWCGEPMAARVQFRPAPSLYFQHGSMRNLVVFELPAVNALLPLDIRRFFKLIRLPLSEKTEALAAVDETLTRLGV